jgi:hypothetical protein
VLLTITTTRAPATDLGYLLHKHPDRLQSFAVSAGEAHVFYPEATPERCTAALLLEIDPISLVRGRKDSKYHKNGELAQYVNDRPYAASSMLAVAIKEAFRTAPRRGSGQRQQSRVRRGLDQDRAAVLRRGTDRGAARPGARGGGGGRAFRRARHVLAAAGRRTAAVERQGRRAAA